MNPIDYLIIAVIAGAAALAVYIIARRRKNGGCSCGCSDCPNASSCKGRQDKK